MIDFLFLLGSGLFCILIQTSPFLHQHLFPLKFDLTIPLTVCIALSTPSLRGGLAVLGIGGLIDIFSGGVLGFYVFMRETIFFLALLLKKALVWENKLFCFLLIVFSFLIEGVFACLVFWLLEKNTAGVCFFLKDSFFESLLSLLIWVCLYPLFSLTKRGRMLFGGHITPRC